MWGIGFNWYKNWYSSAPSLEYFDNCIMHAPAEVGIDATSSPTGGRARR